MELLLGCGSSREKRIVVPGWPANWTDLKTVDNVPEGTTLEQIVSRRGPTSAAVVASLGLQICAGLHYAHANKIIHRDIKPANLFYTRERVVKIMDFGLAKMIEEVRKGATMIGGTPYFMAPEQALGQNVDHRADLYALGVTFFNLLTNGHPFESGDVTFHHSHTAAPDVRERVPGIPEEMAALVARLMAKRPEDRFQSAAEVAQALQRIGAAATARANPPSA